MFKRLCLSLLLLSLVAASAPAGAPAARTGADVLDVLDMGRPAVRAFTDKDGLQSNGCMAIARDARGYVWIETQDGVASYNGRS